MIGDEPAPSTLSPPSPPGGTGAGTGSDAVERARSLLLSGEPATDDWVALARTLEDRGRYRLARALLLAARRGAPGRRRGLALAHAHARCLYKDPDLSTAVRFDRALAVLDEADELARTRNQETLGLAGAVHKRKWEVEARPVHLERALAFYDRGRAEGVRGDLGYTGVNAAFCADLLAGLEDPAGPGDAEDGRRARALRERARTIREGLVRELPPLLAERPELAEDWWFLMTLAEARLGLGDFGEARAWLERGRTLDPPEWKLESAARQLAALARIRDAHPGDGTGAWAVLGDFLGGDATALRSAMTGKVGLALSGGGFRASLFHIGVLARLAEVDLLRHVEVLSCVSGGSIVGAHYYLEVRRLLQNTADGRIRRAHYLDIVRRMEEDFLRGVQKNIRTRVGASLVGNLRMLFSRTYSRTHRAGELFESELYRRVPDGNGRRPRWLDGLFVRPHGAPPEFSPRRHNWRRWAKVPELVLNATTLNTGRNWQFTASWMGEPPAYGTVDPGSTSRLRRLYYDDAPEGHRRLRLGHAVAASACVPGLFEPLALQGLYPDRTVRLVDGGVHDNQGIHSLLEQDCSVILMSDASGRLGSHDDPGPGPLAVPLRSMGILSSRIRAAQLEHLDARRRAGLLRGFMVVDLRRELRDGPVDWIGCREPASVLEGEEGPADPDGLTTYGIRRHLQERIAAIRTDLDTFSTLEAYALMLSGYRMAERELEGGLPGGLPDARGERVGWRFLAADPLLRRPRKPGSPSRMERVLDVARHRTLKIWRLSPALRFVGTLALVLAVGALGALAWQQRDRSLLTVGGLALIVLALVAGMVLPPLVTAAYARTKWRETLLTALFGVVGFAAAWSHLLFDRIYLSYGALRVEDGGDENDGEGDGTPGDGGGEGRTGGGPLEERPRRAPTAP